jgi:hypothetical protein
MLYPSGASFLTQRLVAKITGYREMMFPKEKEEEKDEP